MRWTLLLALVLLLPLPARAIDFDWALVDDPGNPADPVEIQPLHSTTGNWHVPSCLGWVPYAFEITRTEIRVWQYVAFLNAIAQDDPNGAYNPYMAVRKGCDGSYQNVYCSQSQIGRTGAPGAYSYVVYHAQHGWPVGGINQLMAKRFANWLHNGQPSGPQGPATTEDGAYTCTGPTHCGPRNPGAQAWVPDVDEIHKAAYWDPDARVWYRWPTSSNETPVAEPPSSGANSVSASGDVACHEDQVNPNPPNTRGCEASPAGAYPNTVSPFGVLDLCGSLVEMLDTCGETGGALDCSKALLKMPSWWGHATGDCRSDAMTQAPANTLGATHTGFRIVRFAPGVEPPVDPTRPRCREHRCGGGYAVALPLIVLLRRRRGRAARQASGSRLPTSSAGIR